MFKQNEHFKKSFGLYFMQVSHPRPPNSTILSIWVLYLDYEKSLEITLILICTIDDKDCPELENLK